MNETSEFPAEQRDNLMQSLVDELGRTADEEAINVPRAFAKLALRWIGQDPNTIEGVTDGAGDRGLDAYQITSNGITLYQFKARDTLDKDEIDAPGGSDLIGDIARLIDLLASDGLPGGTANSATRQFLSRLGAHVRIYAEAEEIARENSANEAPAPILITIRLVTLTNGLTRQAREEFDQLKRQRDVIPVMGTNALLEIELISIDELISRRWREQNTEWRDASGHKNESIKLRVEGQKIKDKSSMIFYTKAIDLIDAYNRFGYQLFEPNVRCQITNSRVNREISKQVDTEKGIRQFKYLNNGVTLVYQSESSRETYVNLVKPGIVNGLQTVTTLAAKHSTMKGELKSYFEQKCDILVRIYGKSDISVPTLVKATNNQNPMEPRNLKSNDPEQILLEQRFAELGWFYERKDYAWEAFISDEKAWPTLKNATRRKFQVQTGAQGRPSVRRIDNQDAAQAWLAFTGHANEAVQRKRDLFTDERFYDHAFKARPIKHGSVYDFSFTDSRKAAVEQTSAPLAEALLLASLCNRLSDALTPKVRKHREACVERLNLVGRTREEQDVALNEDPKWLSGLIRASASMLFTEMCGMILFRALGESFYARVPLILQKTDMFCLFQDASVEPIRKIVEAKTPNPEENDLFSILWLTYSYLTDSIASDISWRNSFFQQSSRPRFLYSTDMRRRIKDYVENFDQRLRGIGVPLNWTGQIEKKGGVYEYVRTIIST